jgi:fused signal recognition particle receptor
MGLLNSLWNTFTGKAVDWESLEDSLIRADLGVPLTQKIVADLQKLPRVTADDVVAVTRREIVALLPPGNPPILPRQGRPTVILVVGVNGTGKTTSSAKLAHHLKAKGSTVLLAAADTFRAAAIEQLATWGERLGIEVVKGQYNGDPAALCFDALQRAEKLGVDYLICDTAGRLHTRHNLMQELAKIRRSLAKRDPTAPHEVLLVVDATTGSNALSQAREFKAAVGLTGLIVTKLDGSGRGGVLVAIQNEIGLPTRFIGTGEQVAAFEPFNATKFVERISDET